MTILYSAFDYADLKYNKQCVSSICSLAVASQFSICNENIIIVTNQIDQWVKWISSISFLKSLDIKIIDSDSIDPHTGKELKLKAIRTFLPTSDSILFIDTDTVFLRYPIILSSNGRRKLRKLNYDFLGVHECAPTSIDGALNINTGLMGFTGSLKSRELAEAWHKIYLHHITQKPGKTKSLADQPIFQNLISQGLTKAWVLHDIFNLRFHPNYNQCESVWSPINMIHNHYLSDNLSKILTENNDIDWYNRFKSFRNLINPLDKCWNPRTIHLEEAVRESINYNE